MKSIRRRSIAGIFSALFLLLASFAQAQTSDANGTAGSSAAQPAVGEPAYWDLVGGFEFDTHGTTYSHFGPGWTRPLNDNLAFQLRLGPSYLTYEFDSPEGRTRVRRPGFAITPGVKFGTTNWFSVGAGPTFQRKHETLATFDGTEFEDKDWETGLNVNGQAYLNPTDRLNVHGSASYSTNDEYLWSRLGVKRQLSNFSWGDRFTHYLGGEVMAQGNDDIRQLQVGALFELLHAPSSMSIMLRGGVKRSSFEFDDDQTGPYIGIGLYRRMR
jgi:hypothetical protein